MITFNKNNFHRSLNTSRLLILKKSLAGNNRFGSKQIPGYSWRSHVFSYFRCGGLYSVRPCGGAFLCYSRKKGRFRVSLWFRRLQPLFCQMVQKWTGVLQVRNMYDSYMGKQVKCSKILLEGQNVIYYLWKKNNA